MGIKILNNATAVLAGAITASDTTISVGSGTGALFPVLSTGDYFYAALEDTSGNYEIVKVTARSSDAMTVVRAQEGTTARAFAAGMLFDLRMTAQTFYDYIRSVVGDATVDTFTGDGSTVAFTPLSYSPTSIQQVIVAVGGIIQKPTTDYTVSGSTLTFTTAPPAGHAIIVFMSMPTAAGSVVVKSASDGAAYVPPGTTAQRPGSPVAGMFRFNSTSTQFEGYNGTTWGAVGGGATGGTGNAAFYENDQTITADYSITSGKNAMTAGPITINSGITVTVPTGSTWTVV